MTRASFKKYVKKAAERAEKNASHEISPTCTCMPCVIARYQVLSISLESRLFKAVQEKIARRGEVS